MNDTKYIAVVDDHTLFRKGIITLINLFPNYKVLFEAGNGEEFIKELDANKLPDIVLLDISMPKMDGFQTAEWIKNNYPDVKVLALSTMDNEASIIKMIKHGSKGYVLKDADPGELKLAFDEVLSCGFFYNDLVTRKMLNNIHKHPESLPEEDPISKLSSRELEFLKLACSEKSYSLIAREMFVSERTVDGYRDSLFKKLGITSRVGLVMFAIRNNIVSISG